MSTDLITTPTLHIMIGGHSHDAPIADLDIGDASSDEQVKRSTAAFFEFPVEKLRFHEVVRHESGNITIQPQAEFGTR